MHTQFQGSRSTRIAPQTGFKAHDPRSTVPKCIVQMSNAGTREFYSIIVPFYFPPLAGLPPGLLHLDPPREIFRRARGVMPQRGADVVPRARPLQPRPRRRRLGRQARYVLHFRENFHLVFFTRLGARDATDTGDASVAAKPDPPRDRRAAINDTRTPETSRSP